MPASVRTLIRTTTRSALPGSLVGHARGVRPGAREASTDRSVSTGPRSSGCRQARRHRDRPRHHAARHSRRSAPATRRANAQLTRGRGTVGQQRREEIEAGMRRLWDLGQLQRRQVLLVQQAALRRPGLLHGLPEEGAESRVMARRSKSGSLPNHPWALPLQRERPSVASALLPAPHLPRPQLPRRRQCRHGWVAAHCSIRSRLP